METWIITPVSWTLILIFVLMPILLLFAGLDALFNFIHNNINIITIIGVVITIICSLSAAITTRKPLFLLSIPLCALVITQFLYMLIRGSEAIYVMDQDYLAAFWRLIVFFIWLVYMILNLGLSLLGMGMGALSTVLNKIFEEDDYFFSKLSPMLCAIAGGVGWIINYLFI